MALPEIVSREEWLVARKAHLAREKELTRELDALHVDRRRLPMVRVDDEYTFEGLTGEATLRDLFEGRPQLVVFAVVSWAPFAKIRPFQERMGWRFPWYSADGNRFNVDFHATVDDSVLPPEYNYRSRVEWARTSFPMPDPAGGAFDLPALSCFLLDGDVVYHTYSSYGRGLDMIGFTTNLLDRTALGRQEEWEEPTGRATGLGAAAGSTQFRYHDEYDA